MNTERPTPSRWPGSVRVGAQTVIHFNDSNDQPVTKLVTRDFEARDLIDLDFDWPDDTSYATTTIGEPE